MKIIDILNRIANGEEVPKKILFLGNTYRYDEIDETYRNIGGNTNIGEMHNLKFYLNDEVEILEEEKKIPGKLNLYYHINNDVEEETGETTFNDLCDIIGNLRKHEDTINSIIDYLKSKGGNKR